MFVVGFSIAITWPPDLPLAQLLLEHDRTAITRLHALVSADLPAFAWDAIVVRLLERPAWLPPVMVGIVAGGLLITLMSRPSPPNGRRKRAR